MDSRLYRLVCPGRVIKIQRSNGEGRGGDRDGGGGGGGPGRRLPPSPPGAPLGSCRARGGRGRGRAGAQRRPLPGLIHKATVKTVNADRSSVSVEWCEGGTVKGKEVSDGLTLRFCAVTATRWMRPGKARTRQRSRAETGLLPLRASCRLLGRNAPESRFSRLWGFSGLWQWPSGFPQDLVCRVKRGPFDFPSLRAGVKYTLCEVGLGGRGESGAHEVGAAEILTLNNISFGNEQTCLSCWFLWKHIYIYSRV